MPYATFEDIVGRYREMNKAGDDADISSNHIFGAEQEINSRLAGAFSVPFSGNYPLIKDMAIDLTYVRYMEPRNPDIVEKMRERIDSIIDGILSGKYKIVSTSGDILSAGINESITSTTINYTPIFGVGCIEEMYPDVDRINDEADARD